jgi:hypothetical protein
VPPFFVVAWDWDDAYLARRARDSWPADASEAADDSTPSAAQADLLAAEAERIRIENAQRRAESLGDVQDANRARRAAEIEVLRQRNARTAKDLARLFGSEETASQMPAGIAWPAALQDGKFAGYRRVVERAAALRAAGFSLTGQEQSHLAESHRAVLRILRDSTADGRDAAAAFVANLQAGGLPQAEAVAAD